MPKHFLKITTILAFLTFAVVSHAGPRAKPCKAFLEGDSVSLIGRIVKRTYPGPPNYQNIAQGDRAETFSFLQLPAATCFAAPALDQGKVNVQMIQLLTRTQLPSHVVPTSGQHVNVTGKLFLAQSGHHHTPFLLEVVEVRVQE